MSRVLDTATPEADISGKLAKAREHATSVALNHVNDDGPGIRRRGSGRGFFYLDPQGKRLRDEATLHRIRMLAIPPAWAAVWICADEDGHIQATGRDLKGRKQYRYHERWAVCRDDVKFSSLAQFAAGLPLLRTAIDADLRRHSLSRDRVVAAVVWLLDHTMIRVGNPAYARDNKSFGLTTLRSKHVEVEGAKLRFSFKGKSGKEWRLKLVDRRMARILRSIQELPGQSLFQYFDDDGERRIVRSTDVNDYLREQTGEPFTSKHFRTWGGTVHAASVLAGTELPDTRSAKQKVLNAAVDQVAARLGNTRTVCRSCYIHPGVIAAWETGTLTHELHAARRSFRKVPDGLDEEEMLVRRWLEMKAAGK